jgi:hypothetical protein
LDISLLLAVLAGLVGFFAFLLVVYLAGNWLAVRIRKPKAPSADAIRRYRERLASPRWLDLEQHFGQSIPTPIKHLYTRTELLQRKDVLFRTPDGRAWPIARFLPADLQTLDEVWPDLKGPKFPFAEDFVGDCYYVPLNGDPTHKCAVMYYHHDGGDFEVVSDSLDAFMMGPVKDKSTQVERGKPGGDG